MSSTSGTAPNFSPAAGTSCDRRTKEMMQPCQIHLHVISLPLAARSREPERGQTSAGTHARSPCSPRLCDCPTQRDDIQVQIRQGWIISLVARSLTREGPAVLDCVLDQLRRRRNEIGGQPCLIYTSMSSIRVPPAQWARLCAQTAAGGWGTAPQSLPHPAPHLRHVRPDDSRGRGRLGAEPTDYVLRHKGQSTAQPKR